jgi:hypothetical protein
MNYQKVTKAVREIMSEPTGQLSWGRVASSIALLASLSWVSYLLLKTRSLPSLDGITAFALSFYGSNKVTTAIEKFSSKSVQTPPPMDPPK